MYGQFLLSFVPKLSQTTHKFSGQAYLTGDDTWLCDFMDVKLPKYKCSSPRLKKRSLAPWKVWNRHWCSVRKMGPGLGLEVLLDCGVGSAGLVFPNDKENRLRIPANAIICRTESKTKQYAFGIFPRKERKPVLYLASSSESESQRWMSRMRQQLRPRLHRFMEGTFSISMVDNSHSRSAGLTGLYGDLIASRSGVFVKDVNNGEIIEIFEWRELGQFHLATKGLPEDVKRVVVIHTTKEFRGGVGELHLFCLDAPKLLQSLLTQGRDSTISSNERPSRPLSLSEGDLRLSIPDQDSINNLQVLKQKVTSGLGILLRSRTNSEVKLATDKIESKALERMTSRMGIRHRAIDNEYHPEPVSGVIPDATSSLEELEEPVLRRVSAISNASGIYEEILDNHLSRPRNISSNLYENTQELIFNCPLKLEPPPLPPRQRTGSGSTTRSESTGDESVDSEIEDNFKIKRNHFIFDTSEYVMMCPRARDLLLMDLEEEAKNEEIYLMMR